MKLKEIKNYKYWGKIYKRMFIVECLRNILNIIAAITLYVTLHNTGLLIYIICMLHFRWKKEDEGL